jgi:hypothetical protein
VEFSTWHPPRPHPRWRNRTTPEKRRRKLDERVNPRSAEPPMRAAPP